MPVERVLGVAAVMKASALCTGWLYRGVRVIHSPRHWRRPPGELGGLVP